MSYRTSLDPPTAAAIRASIDTPTQWRIAQQIVRAVDVIIEKTADTDVDLTDERAALRLLADALVA